MAEPIVTSSTFLGHLGTFTESIQIGLHARPVLSFHPCSTGSGGVRSLGRCKLALVRGAVKDLDSSPPGPASPGECVRKLYYCINEKKLKGSGRIITEDCCFEDFTFPKPFNGNKEIVTFLEQLGDSMGKNVKFCLMEVHDDGDAAWANWHLEWKGTEIPFTRGCSNFHFSKQGDDVLIRKAQVFSESPIKPGGLVLILLRAVTLLFDEFPKSTESFLKSPQVVIQFVQRVYLMFLAPFIKPLLASYINFGKLIIRVLGYVVGVLIVLLKLLFK